MKRTYKDFQSRIPIPSETIKYKTEANGTVIIEIKNKGIMNKTAQIILKKPKTSFIHLDDIGSFVWQNINGKRNFEEIAYEVDKKFGESAYPLHERLSQFLGMLEKCSFILWK